jgi:hypothetical protein
MTMAHAPVSFAADIKSVLLPYRDQMIWRLDLARYEEVRANAEIIYPMISSTPPQMPPPPFPGFSQTFIDAFAAWMQQGYPL